MQFQRFGHLYTNDIDSGEPALYLRSVTYLSGHSEAMAMPCEGPVRPPRGGARVARSRDEQSEASIVSSMSRARRRVKELVHQMCPDTLLTLTYRANVTDEKEAWSTFQRFCRQMKKRFPGWCYVAVPELQERGAWHWHLCIRGWYDAVTLRNMWRRAVGDLQGNIDLDHRGWIRNRSKMATYLGKYITKSGVFVAINRRRYSSGGKIPPPVVWRGYIGRGLPIIDVLLDILDTKKKHRYGSFREFTARGITFTFLTSA